VILCILRSCPGHDDQTDAILHGQHAIRRDLAAIRQALGIIHADQEYEMGIAQDILAAENSEAAAVDALGAAVETALGKLDSVQAQLADLLANGSLSDDDKAALQQALDTANASRDHLGASLAEVNAALNPPEDVGGPAV
jgi:hypothetical protein